MSRKLLITAAVLVVTAGVFYFAYPYAEIGRLWFGVVGVDVSHYQEDIDWSKVSQGDVRFAYIKATEGGDYVDPNFADNWRQARAAGLAVGAYHFFTRCKSGQEQAKNLLNVLPSDADALPPAIDVEEMKPCSNSQASLDPADEIVVLVELVQKALGCRPIIYSTPEFDLTYLRGKLAAESFWVRSVMFPPLLRRDTWVFWQYHDAGHRNGISKPVDLNVFRGTAAEFANYRASHICTKRIGK